MKDRFARIVSDSGLSVKDFAAEVGLHPNSVTEILHGRTKSVSRPIMFLLNQRNRVNLNWLVAGDGDPYLEPRLEPLPMALLSPLEIWGCQVTFVVRARKLVWACRRCFTNGYKAGVCEPRTSFTDHIARVK